MTVLSIDPLRLQDYNLARLYDDRGTLVAADTQTTIEGNTFDYGGEKTSCRVTKAQITLSSHAGTHADRPSHFHPKPEFDEFPLECYRGPAIILNVSKALSGRVAVTAAMLQEALMETPRTSTESIQRVLVRTNPDDNYATEPQPMFSHFSPDIEDFLREHQCKLLGIDTASVDHPTEKHLIDAVHGVLYQQRIAILENLNLSGRLSEEGIMVTVFDEARSFPDAKGISALYFFPLLQS